MSTFTGKTLMITGEMIEIEVSSNKIEAIYMIPK